MGILSSKFGEILVARGRLDPDSLDQALRLQADEPSTRIGELLLRLGLVTAQDVAQTLAAQFDLPVITAAEFPEFPVLEEQVSARFLRESAALPVAEDADVVAVAMVNPNERFVADAFGVLTGRAVTVRVAARDDFESAFERLYGSGRTAMGQIVEDIESVEVHDFDGDVQHLKDLASEAPVIRLVGLVIRRALETRASDIHIEPFENRLIVRYRIDGVMHEVESPPRRLSAAVISRRNVR